MLADRAIAAEWDMDASIGAGAIWSSNITLERDGAEIEDVVYTVSPQIILMTDGPRLRANLRYRADAFFYDDFSDFNDVFNVLDAEGTSALVEDALFLYLSAVNFQSSSSTEDNFPTTNLPITDNRADQTILTARPYWDQDLGFARVFAEYSYTDVNYDLSGTENSVEQRSRFQLDNLDDLEGVTWSLNYDHARVEYDTSPPWEFQSATAELGYWFGQDIRLFGRGGVETPYNSFLDPAMEESLWEAGFEYRSGSRAYLLLAAGERSFGETYRGEFDYTLRRGRLNVSHTEGPVTRAQQGFEFRPLNDQDNLDDFLSRTGESDRYVRKRSDLSLVLELARTDVSVRLFYESRTDRFTADGQPREEERYGGGSLRFDWEVGTRGEIGLAGDFGRREFSSRQEDISRYLVSYTYNFSPRFNVVLSAQRSEERPDDPAAGNNYEEDQLGLIFRWQST